MPKKPDETEVVAVAPPSKQIMVTKQSDNVPPLKSIPTNARAFFHSGESMDRVYNKAWEQGYLRSGVTKDEKVLFSQVRAMPTLPPQAQGYDWSVLLATEERLLTVKGNSVDICPCNLQGTPFSSCQETLRSCCHVEYVSNSSTMAYKWQEVVDTKYATTHGPGNYPFVGMCMEAPIDCRTPYKACCLESLKCWMNAMPCLFKRKDKLPKCIQCFPTLVDSTEVSLALNAEGFNYNPFWSLFLPGVMGANYKSYHVERLDMDPDEAKEFLKVTSGQMSKAAKAKK